MDDDLHGAAGIFRQGWRCGLSGTEAMVKLVHGHIWPLNAEVSSIFLNIRVCGRISET